MCLMVDVISGLVTLNVVAAMPPVPPAKPDLPLPKFVDSLWCIYVVSVVAAWNAEFSKLHRMTHK